MRYYLAQYTGTGVAGDEFRPVGSDETAGAAWSSIDLRRPGNTSGWCLFATSATLPNLQGLVDLGTDPDGAVPPAVQRRISDRLGVEVVETTVRRLFRELLIDHARTDGTRWRPLGIRRKVVDGTVRRVREVVLGGAPVWEQILPLDTPGATLTETFVQADSTTLGPNLTWSEVQGDPQTIADTARAGSLGTQTHARAQHDLDTDDHYCSARVGNPTTSGSGVRFGGPMVRFSPSANTSYFFRWQWSNAGGHQLAILRNNAGSYTNLTSVATSPGNPSTLRLEVNGSSLRALEDGVEVLTTTDTNITGNLRCGFGLQAQSNLNQILIDVWSAGDLTPSVTLVVQDATHAHTADNVTLTQDHVLTVADAAHAHAADNVVLTQAHTLAVQDALHAHTADNVTLGQLVTLAVQDATHGHTVDNVTLVPGADLLAVQDALHAHTADQVTLVQAHVLAVDGAFHLHVADNVRLRGAASTLRLRVRSREPSITAGSAENPTRVTTVRHGRDTTSSEPPTRITTEVQAT